MPAPSLPTLCNASAACSATLFVSLFIVQWISLYSRPLCNVCIVWCWTDAHWPVGGGEGLRGACKGRTSAQAVPPAAGRLAQLLRSWFPSKHVITASPQSLMLHVGHWLGRCRAVGTGCKPRRRSYPKTVMGHMPRLGATRLEGPARCHAVGTLLLAILASPQGACKARGCRPGNKKDHLTWTRPGLSPARVGAPQSPTNLTTTTHVALPTMRARAHRARCGSRRWLALAAALAFILACAPSPAAAQTCVVATRCGRGGEGWGRAPGLQALWGEPGRRGEANGAKGRRAGVGRRREGPPPLSRAEPTLPPSAEAAGACLACAALDARIDALMLLLPWPVLQRAEPTSACSRGLAAAASSSRVAAAPSNSVSAATGSSIAATACSSVSAATSSGAVAATNVSKFATAPRPCVPPAAQLFQPPAAAQLASKPCCCAQLLHCLPAATCFAAASCGCAQRPAPLLPPPCRSRPARRWRAAPRLVAWSWRSRRLGTQPTRR